MRKSIKVICLLIGLILVLVGCSGQTTEEEYIDFVNDSLDKSEQALDKVYTVQVVALEGEEYWQLKDPVNNLTKTITDILTNLDNTDPPENFTKEHENLRLMFLAQQEYANKLKLYSETGDKKHFDNIGKTIDSFWKYHANSVFTTEEYRERGYERTTDYKELMTKVENVNRMKPDEYLIDIKDVIDNYFMYIDVVPQVVQTMSVLPNSNVVRDTADGIFKGFDLLHQKLSLMKPPKEYDEAHNKFIKSVEQAKLSAEYLTKFARNPNSKNLLNQALSSFRAINADGIKELNNAVKTDLK